MKASGDSAVVILALICHVKRTADAASDSAVKEASTGTFEAEVSMSISWTSLCTSKQGAWHPLKAPLKGTPKIFVDFC